MPDTLSEQLVNFRGGDLNALYDVDGRFAHLKPNDVAVVHFGHKDDRFIQITHRYRLSGEDMLRGQPQLAWPVSQQIGREPTFDDMIDVLEVRDCYKHQWEGRR
ncbi:hypothetical protein [Sagittula sp.]|uniref:hypothetical protein n=1 Tax=Sagittula sp. TaxID=2038081 RepID=UPI0035124078